MLLKKYYITLFFYFLIFSSAHGEIGIKVNNNIYNEISLIKSLDMGNINSPEIIIIISKDCFKANSIIEKLIDKSELLKIKWIVEDIDINYLSNIKDILNKKNKNYKNNMLKKVETKIVIETGKVFATPTIIYKTKNGTFIVRGEPIGNDFEHMIEDIIN